MGQGHESWSVIDLRTDAMTAGTFGSSANQSQYAALNTEFKAPSWVMPEIPCFYFKVDSLKFYYTFLIHFLAGTDSARRTRITCSTRRCACDDRRRDEELYAIRDELR